MKNANVRVLVTSHILPSIKISSHELERRYDLRPGSIEKCSGVSTRHWCSEDENQATMAAKASLKAMYEADLRPCDLDAIVCANGVAQQLIPCNGILLQKELGPDFYGIPCFDFNATCLSFICALDHLSLTIECGRYRRVLITSADVASRGINGKSLESLSLFGDAASAVVIEKNPDTDSSSKITCANMRSYSKSSEQCQIPYGGAGRLAYHYCEEDHEQYLFSMDGPRIFKETLKHIGEFVDETLAKAGCKMEEIDIVVCHQASASAIRLLQRRLKIPAAKLINIIKDHGNCVSASIPMALDIAVKNGRLRRGDRVLILGTGAGLSLGALIFTY